jgi:hypothetical protein
MRVFFLVVFWRLGHDRIIAELPLTPSVRANYWQGIPKARSWTIDADATFASGYRQLFAKEK